MDYIPIGKRTRLQRSIIMEKLMKENKRARMAAKNEFLKKRKEENGGHDDDDEDDDDSEDDPMIVDESEFLKGVVNNLGSLEKDKVVVKCEVNGEDSDDSCQFLEERWNPLGMDDADNSDDDYDDDIDANGGNVDDGCRVVTEYKDEHKGVLTVSESSSLSDEDVTDVSDDEFLLEKPEVSSSSDISSSDGDSMEEEDEDRVLNLVNGGDGRKLVINGEHDRKKKQQVSSVEFRERVYKRSDIAASSSSVKCSMKKRIRDKIRSKVTQNFPRKKEAEDVSHVTIVMDKENKKSVSSSRFRGAAMDRSFYDHESYEAKKQERLVKKQDVELEAAPLAPQKKQRKKRLKAKEIENILLNTILEKGNAGSDEFVSNTSTNDEEDQLVRKFRYGDQNVVPEKTEDELELESLFKELDFGLGVCDIGLEAPCLEPNEEESDILCDSAISQEKLCLQGKHYLIHDEEIGIRCKFCLFVELEIRDVTPAFNVNPFGRSTKKYNESHPYDTNVSSDKFQFPDSSTEIGVDHAKDTCGTVWDLIPGMKRTLYEHQQKGFEFMWNNIAGGIKLDNLSKPSKFGVGGCIICHAPGTGKTRLAIVFLQSFIKQYSMSKPIIIAPSSMLLTWEEEFARWNVDVPFLNLNSADLSPKEIEALRCVDHLKHSKAVRKAKLCIWAMGKGILGISYTLFEQLAGEREEKHKKDIGKQETDKIVKKALLEQAGILVLDEGHTPRNDGSKIWKVLSEVKTRRRIILSGTPFQNNFEELYNTITLVREEFGDPFNRGNNSKGGIKISTDKRIEDLRDRMKAFVHVHKGEILRKTLPGLFHSVLVLKPSELQKTCFKHLEKVKNGLKSDHLVSIASVHPWLLCACEPVPYFVDEKMLDKHKTELGAGVKTRFLFELIKLSKGEKVLVFSQFLHPLTFIGELLKTHMNWNEGKEYIYMEGKQRPKQRQSLIRLFNDPESEARVLLASTKACCEGIHLVGASRVVLLDVVWNPSVERQAISRAYRLGQKKDVFVYHLITSGTPEGEKYFRQVEKDRLSEQVFTSSDGEGGENTATLSRVSEDQILEEMIQHQKLKYMFEKIIYQPKADNLIDSFAPLSQ